MAKPINPFECTEDHLLCHHLNTAIWGNHVPPEVHGDLFRIQFAKLEDHELLFMAVDIFNRDAMCEGMFHYFYYESGELFDKTCEGLEKIGAASTADILREYAQFLFGNAYPVDVETRQDLIDNFPGGEEAAYEEPRRYDPDEITAKLAAWARANLEYFRI